MTHKYILEPYKGLNTRYHCPNCKQKDKTFSLYIDTETGEHLHPTVGRCNRESNCGYHYTPKQYFQDNHISFDTPQPKIFKQKAVISKQKPVSFIPFNIFKATQQGYKTNHFFNFLVDSFGYSVAVKVTKRYEIATSKHWQGATVFWQIDTKGNIRTGKIMLYDAETGKRVKKPYNHITWAHIHINQPDFELKQCFFGEHLLNEDNKKPVGLVESEKTAIICSIYYPELIWLAVGSLTNLNAEKCKVLKGRTVILFPDLNGFEKWSKKAKELNSQFTGTKFIVSELLERNATQIERSEVRS